MVRGRYLGGSTTVNGGYFVRARREDFDRWAAAGNPAWAYEGILPFLRAMETDLDFGAGDVHGADGPMFVGRGELKHPAAAAFAAAAQELGFPHEPDKNAQSRPGFGPVPSNAVDGVRLNTGVSYLWAALDRPNLTVVGNGRVLRVVITSGRATGVLVDHGGLHTPLEAGEVVLCAGSFVTPHLLQLSGIGPRADLERLGLPVLKDASSVGARFSDHPRNRARVRSGSGETKTPSAVTTTTDGSSSVLIEPSTKILRPSAPVTRAWIRRGVSKGMGRL
ncbi:GMC family oxidoreductase [Streptomyces mirabilis]|uniref:GMC family oxidoreductase n=1 Tax=Streptomyces mirabilis TaxID=68239 RepID=UPI0037145D69